MAGNPFSFYLTVVEKDGPLIKLWGQMDRGTVEYIDSYLVKVNDLYAKGSGKLLPKSIGVGQMCCAEYNGIFYRARITSVANISAGLVIVRFVDYGNSKVTPIENLRVVDETLSRLPPQATEFYLYGVTPLTGVDLEDVTTDYMRQQLCYQEFQGCLVLGINDKRLIKLFQNGVDYNDMMVAQKLALPMDHKHQYAILKSNVNPQLHTSVVQQNWRMQAHIPPTQYAQKAPILQSAVYDVHGMAPNAERASPMTYGETQHSAGEMTVKTFTSPILEPNSEHSVYISNVEDGPLSFAVQLQAAEQTLIAVTADIAAHRPIPLREPPVPGSVCLGRFPGDNKLSRATIMEVMDSTCRLYYVDFGNVSDVPYTDIFELPTKLINPKAMALRFSLAGLKNGPPPSNITKEAFKDVVKGCLLQLRVAPTPEGPPLKQYGYLYRDGRDVRILYEELAKERARGMTSVPAVVNYARAPVTYEPSKGDAVVDSTWVTISHLNSPDEFWVQLESDQTALEQVMVLLDEYCNKTNHIPSISELRVKSPVFARFSEDDRWYRACILKIVPGGDSAVVHVEFVDYGNEEDITEISRLRLAEPAMVSALAAQAIRCRLSGAANVRCKVGAELWEEISVKFSDLTLESRGMIKLGPRGIGDPVVVIDELRDDTLTPPVAITMDAIYKAVVGSLADDTSVANATPVYANSTSGDWQGGKKAIKDYNANPSSRHGDYSGHIRPHDASKGREDSGMKSWEGGKGDNEGRGRRVGGRNGNQEIGNWDGEGAGSEWENEGAHQNKRHGRTSYHNSGGEDNWGGGGRGGINGQGEDGSGRGSHRGGRGGRQGRDVWDSSRQSDSDGGEAYYGDRRSRRGGRGGSFDSFSHGDSGGFRGGRRGGAFNHNEGRSHGDDGDWENKDSSGQSDTESSGGKGGYRRGRGGRGRGGEGGDRGFRGTYGGRDGWEDRNSSRQRDEDGGFGGGSYGGRSGGRGGRDGGEWDGGSHSGRGGRYHGSEYDSSSRGGRGGGGYHGNRGRDGGDRPKRFGSGDRDSFGDSRGGWGGKGGDADFGGSWRDNKTDGMDSRNTYQSTISAVAESGETWEDDVAAPVLSAAADQAGAAITTTNTPSQIEEQSIDAGTTEQVNVVYVESRANFFCHLNNQVAKLDEITTLLSENYSTMDPTTKEKGDAEEITPDAVQLSKAAQINVSSLEIGMPCAALYSEDGVWYRARVIGEPTEGSIAVNFVDYGNKGDVAVGGLKELPINLRSLPAQAIYCSLLGLDRSGAEDGDSLDVDFETEVTSGEASYSITFVRRSIVDGNECVEVLMKNRDSGECVNTRFGGSEELPVDTVDESNSKPPGNKGIPAPDITLGSTIEVDVVYVASRKEFYCQPQGTNEELHGLMDKLASLCIVEEKEGDNNKSVSQHQVTKASQISITAVEIGTPCAARFSDEVWYRAVVDGEATEEGISVRFIDYGNKSDVAEGGLRELPVEMCSFPAQAIRCCLLGLEEETGDDESEIMDVNFEAEVTSGEAEYTVTFVKRSTVGQNECMEVVLKNKDTGECVNSHFGGSEEIQNTAEGEVLENVDSISAIPKRDLVIGSTIDVEIVYVAGRREFFCQPKDTAEELQVLMKKLATLCTAEDDDEVAPPCESTLRMFGLKPGMFCAALFSEDSTWYRAQVLDEPKVKETGAGFVVNVKFVDYGNEAEVEESGIRELIPALLTYPAHAVPCRLLGLGDDFVLDSDKEIEFEAFATNAEVTWEAFFVQKTSECDHYEVLIRDTDSQVCINQQFGGIGEVMGGNGFGMRAAVAADQQLDVTVIWFVSPFRFYVQPLHWAKDLTQYMESLQKVQKHSIFPWPPALGTPVIARFVQDGGLYRAVVEEMCTNSMVRVQYVDYGNRENLTQSQVWVADPCFKTLPPQAIPCALKGVSPINDRWPLPGSPESSLDKYFSLENCTCIFHGRIGDESQLMDGIEGEARTWVSVFKPDGSSIIDEIVAAGLAIPDETLAMNIVTLSHNLGQATEVVISETDESTAHPVESSPVEDCTEAGVEVSPPLEPSVKTSIEREEKDEPIDHGEPEEAEAGTAVEPECDQLGGIEDHTLDKSPDEHGPQEEGVKEEGVELGSQKVEDQSLEKLSKEEVFPQEAVKGQSVEVGNREEEDHSLDKSPKKGFPQEDAVKEESVELGAVVEEYSFKVEEGESLKSEKEELGMTTSTEVVSGESAGENELRESVSMEVGAIVQKLGEMNILKGAEYEVKPTSEPSLDVDLMVEKLSEVHKDMLSQQSRPAEAAEDSSSVKMKLGGSGENVETGFRDVEEHDEGQDEEMDGAEESNAVQGLECGPESLDLVMDELVLGSDEGLAGETLNMEECAKIANDVLSVSAAEVSSVDNQDALEDSENFEDAEDTTTSELAKDVLKSSVDGDKDAAARVQQVVEKYYQETPKALPFDRIKVGENYFTPNPADSSNMVPVKVLDLSGTLGAVVEFNEGIVDEVPLDKIYECPPEMAVLPSPDASPMNSLTIIGDSVVLPCEVGQNKSPGRSKLKSLSDKEEAASEPGEPDNCLADK